MEGETRQAQRRQRRNTTPEASPAPENAPDSESSAASDEEMSFMGAFWICCVAPESSAASDEEMTDEEWAQRQTLFNSRCEHLWTLRKESQTQADNLVVTLSAGFLALSATFLKDIVPLSRAVNFNFVVAAWVLLIMAIGATFVSFSFSRKTIEDDLERSEKLYLKAQKDAFEGSGKWTKATELCNAASAICFISALLFFGAFSGINVIQEQDYQRNEAVKAEQAEVRKVADAKAAKLAKAAKAQQRNKPNEQQ